ncbi:MAG: LutC/YkgG family protein [Thermomicrobiales bacterium]
MSVGERDLFAAFEDRAAALGVDVWRVAASDDAARIIAELASDLETSDVLLAAELATSAPRLLSDLAECALHVQEASDLNESRDAPLGLSLARLAIAETGSVLLAETSLADRGIGMLAATQVVICPASSLVASLDDSAGALRAVARQPGGGYATLVTGPSRTADIERVLTVGVQGPARVVVVFVDGLG